MWQKLLAGVLLLLFSGIVARAGDHRARNEFDCGGRVEEQVWLLWDEALHDHLRSKIVEQRILRDGEGDGLYDFQTYTHNLVAMARRCNRIERLRQISRLIDAVYAGLESGSVLSPGRRWACRSGSLCEGISRHAGNEVQLYSVQFLGVASTVANAIATSGRTLTKEDERFVSATVQVAVEHLERWGSIQDVARLHRLAKTKPEDVRSNSSSLLFTDKPLWMISVYAELAGIVSSRPEISPDGETRKQAVANLGPHFDALMEAFLARVSLEQVNVRKLGSVTVGDLDRGYWRLYPDNQYAGYEDSRPPVSCRGGQASGEIEVHVAPESVRKRSDVGWDLSHARRLVPALDALERNRAAIKRVYSLSDKKLMPASIPRAFANALVARVWNGNENEPLFTNYWSGANGWFRVAYGSERGKCRQGFPPYGMTGAFLSGGYPTWSRYQPTIARLAERLYTTASKSADGHNVFISEYYPDLLPSAVSLKAKLFKLMSLPSLVGVREGQRE